MQTYSEAIASSTEPEFKMVHPHTTPAPFPLTGVTPNVRLQPSTSEPRQSALFDAAFQRWLEARLQQWTEVAVALGEARWSRLGGLRSRYY